MYTILEASTLTGVSRDMIRYYEKKGVLLPQRGGNRYRYYTDDDLLRLVMIRFYSNMGISLHDLTERLRHSDVGSITDALRRETQRLEMLQNQLAARAEAARHTLSALEQYTGEQPYAIRTLRRRYLYSRDRHSQQDYVALCAQLAAGGCFFQYYYLQTLAIEGDKTVELSRDVGLLLYDPLPFDIPDITELPQQPYYQKTMAIAPGYYQSGAELKPHVDIAARHSRLTHFWVISYQVFASGNPEGSNVISIEIPLGEQKDNGR